MRHSELIKKGLRGGFLRFEDSAERRRVYYPYANQRFPLTPEEEVRMETYLTLILELGYPPDHLSFEHKVKMGSSYKYVDIVFYGQKASQNVKVIVECKRRDVSDKGFKEAIRQAKSYDRQLLSADYLWITSGKKNTYLRASHAKRGRNYQEVPALPRFSMGRRLGQRLHELAFFTGKQTRELTAALREVSIGKTGVFALLLIVLGFFMSWGTVKLVVPFITSRSGLLFGNFHYGYLFWLLTFLTTFIFISVMRQQALPELYVRYQTDRAGRKRRRELTGKQRLWPLIFAVAVLSTPTLLLSEVFFDYEDFCTRCCAHLWDCWWSERHYGSFDPSWRMMEFFIPFSFGIPFQLLALVIFGRAKRALQ